MGGAADVSGNDSVKLNGVGPDVSRRRLLGGVGAAGAALSLSTLLAACSDDGGTPQASGGSGGGNYPEHPKWRFTFVNHVTTNPFFVPTQYGAQDACALFNCEYQWTGSQKADVVEMVNAINAAVAAKVDGIAVPVVDTKAFRDPIDRALQAGIPVVSYNADGAVDDKGSARLAYIGQDLFLSGVEMGRKIVELVDSGLVAGFIATPGALNIQPRIDGAKQAIQQSGKSITFEQIATGPDLPEELSRIDAYYTGHQDLKGMFAVDAGSTQGVAQTMKKYQLASKGVKAGGFDLVPITLDGIKNGDLDFTIDQQPYLQGFLPVFELFMYKLSGGLTGPADINTGLLFITRDTVDPYLTTKTRFEGSSEEQQVVQRSGAIKGT
jgi:simple sugar transport system substrate-binding protein